MPLPTPTLSAMTMATLTATLKSPLHTALSPTHRRARVPATPARRLTHCSTPMHICTRTRTRTHTHATRSRPHATRTHAPRTGTRTRTRTCTRTRTRTHTRTRTRTRNRTRTRKSKKSLKKKNCDFF